MWQTNYIYQVNTAYVIRSYKIISTWYLLSILIVDLTVRHKMEKRYIHTYITTYLDYTSSAREVVSKQQVTFTQNNAFLPVS